MVETVKLSDSLQVFSSQKSYIYILLLLLVVDTCIYALWIEEMQMDEDSDSAHHFSRCLGTSRTFASPHREQHNVNQTPRMERLTAPPDTLLV